MIYILIYVIFFIAFFVLMRYDTKFMLEVDPKLNKRALLVYDIIIAGILSFVATLCTISLIWFNGVLF